MTQILKSEGNTTDNMKPIILIEKESEKKQIIAYLTQDEIIHIGRDNVKIYLPALGKTFVGNIVEINRTDGFIDEINAQYRWRDFQIDRSAKIVVNIQENDSFFNKSGYAFCLKPDRLRYIPVIIPDATPQNPALSFQTREVKADYYSFKI